MGNERRQAFEGLFQQGPVLIIGHHGQDTSEYRNEGMISYSRVDGKKRAYIFSVTAVL